MFTFSGKDFTVLSWFFFQLLLFCIDCTLSIKKERKKNNNSSDQVSKTYFNGAYEWKIISICQIRETENIFVWDVNKMVQNGKWSLFGVFFCCFVCGTVAAARTSSPASAALLRLSAAAHIASGRETRRRKRTNLTLPESTLTSIYAHFSTYLPSALPFLPPADIVLKQKTRKSSLFVLSEAAPDWTFLIFFLLRTLCQHIDLKKQTKKNIKHLRR